MKVLLVYVCDPPESADPFGARLPIGLGYLAAALQQADLSCTVANMATADEQTVRSLLHHHRPDVVGFTMYTFNRRAVLRNAAIVKAVDSRTKVVVGGPHATAMGREAIERHQHIDCCIIGEGEAPLLAYLGLPMSVDPLDLHPGRALHEASVDDSDEYRFVNCSRGCRGHCTFCSSPSFWGTNVRHHDLDWILTELVDRQTLFGCPSFSFRDDSFTTERDKVLALCHAIETHPTLQFLWDCQCRAEDIDETLAEAMVRAGCRAVQLGVEHGEPRIRRLLGKPADPTASVEATAVLRRFGIEVSWYLITAIPEETTKDRRTTRDLVERARPHDVMLSPLALYPGTALFRYYARKRPFPSDVWTSTSANWLLALPQQEALAIVQRESRYYESTTKKRRFTTHGLTEAWRTLAKPWPLTYAVALHHLNAGRFELAETMLVDSEQGQSRYWTARLLAELLIADDREDEAIPVAHRAVNQLPACAEMAALLDDIL